MIRQSNMARQQGVVLVVALLILLMTSVLAATAYETNLAQMRMAGNEQARSERLQWALAVIDALVADQANFNPLGGVGFMSCAVGVVADHCDESRLSLALDLNPPVVPSAFTITRKGPLDVVLPSMPEESASSGWHYRGALYEVRVHGGGHGGGAETNSMAQGVLLKRVSRR